MLQKYLDDGTMYLNLSKESEQFYVQPREASIPGTDFTRISVGEAWTTAKRIPRGSQISPGLASIRLLAFEEFTKITTDPEQRKKDTTTSPSIHSCIFYLSMLIGEEIDTKLSEPYTLSDV